VLLRASWMETWNLCVQREHTSYLENRRAEDAMVLVGKHPPQQTEKDQGESRPGGWFEDLL
jgi:hypothetical protein